MEQYFPIIILSIHFKQATGFLTAFEYSEKRKNVFKISTGSTEFEWVFFKESASVLPYQRNLSSKYRVGILLLVIHKYLISGSQKSIRAKFLRWSDWKMFEDFTSVHCSMELLKDLVTSLEKRFIYLQASSKYKVWVSIY